MSIGIFRNFMVVNWEKHFEGNLKLNYFNLISFRYRKYVTYVKLRV